MSAVLPPTVNMQSLLAIKSQGRVVKGIEQMRCRAVRSAQVMENLLQIRRLLSSTPVLGIVLPPHYLTLLLARHVLASRHSDGLFPSLCSQLATCSIIKSETIVSVRTSVRLSLCPSKSVRLSCQPCPFFLHDHHCMLL